MKNKQKNGFSVRRIFSVNQQLQKIGTKPFNSIPPAIYFQNLKEDYLKQSQTDLTKRNKSTLAAISQIFNEDSQPQPEGIGLNGRSLGLISTSKSKNGRLTESFHTYSDNDSEISEVLYIVSRDMKQKKVKELSSSYQFDNFNSTNKKQSGVYDIGNHTQKKIQSKCNNCEILLTKNKLLVQRNRTLEEENINLCNRILRMQEQKEKNKTRIPQFIKDRQLQKIPKNTNHHSTRNKACITGNNHWQISFKQANNSQRNRPERHTIHNCRSFDQLMETMKKGYQKSPSKMFK